MESVYYFFLPPPKTERAVGGGNRAARDWTDRVVKASEPPRVKAAMQMKRAAVDRALSAVMVLSLSFLGS